MSRVWITTIAALDGANNPVTLRFADGAYVDDDANFYEPRMRQPALMREYARAGALLPTIGETSVGEIELINADGGLNYLLDYALDGRECVISSVKNGVCTPFFTGTVTTMSERSGALWIRLRHALQSIEEPFPLSTFPSTHATLAGLPIPKSMGQVLNLSMLLVDAPRLIYQASDGEAYFFNVFDSGIPLPSSGSYSSRAQMDTTQPPAGSFRAYKGLVRLGAKPIGLVTANVDAGGGPYSAYSIFREVIEAFGLTSHPLNTADLLTEGGDICGLYITDLSTSAADQVTRICEALGLYWFFYEGKVRVKKIEPPTITGAIDIPEYVILSIERKSLGLGKDGIPVNKVRIPHSEIITEQTEFAGGVSLHHMGQVAKKWRWAEKDNPATKTRHPLSTMIEVKKGISFDVAKSNGVAQRLVDFLSVRRDIVSVTIALDVIAPVGIGDSVRVFSRRLGYELGRVMICVGYELDARKNRIKLELFG